MGGMGEVKEKITLWQGTAAGKQRHEAEPIEMLAWPQVKARHLEYGGIEIHVDDSSIALRAGFDSGWPADEEGRAHTGFVRE